MIYFNGPWPVTIAFSKSKKETITQIKKMTGETIELNGAATTTHLSNNGAQVAIVTLDAKQKFSKADMASLIAHEASHVWDIVNVAMGCDDPKEEHRAYGIQWITKKCLESLWGKK